MICDELTGTVQNIHSHGEWDFSKGQYRPHHQMGWPPFWAKECGPTFGGKLIGRNTDFISLWVFLLSSCLKILSKNTVTNLQESGKQF